MTCVLCEGIFACVFSFQNFFILLQGSYFMLFSEFNFSVYLHSMSSNRTKYICDTCYFTLSFLPISKLFCEKGSLNPMERWSNLIGSLVSVVRSEWFNTFCIYSTVRYIHCHRYYTLYIYSTVRYTYCHRYHTEPYSMARVIFFSYLL